MRTHVQQSISLGIIATNLSRFTGSLRCVEAYLGKARNRCIATVLLCALTNVSSTCDGGLLEASKQIPNESSCRNGFRKAKLCDRSACMIESKAKRSHVTLNSLSAGTQKRNHRVEFQEVLKSSGVQ